MIKCEISFPIPLPDDPQKWDGWNKYKSPNFYERLCLDPGANPSNELIEERCRELLRWWQKKLPLKNQPSNPLTQLLRPGLDESSRYLTEARVELLDPERRRELDDDIAAQAHEQSVTEFNKLLAFALTDGVLTAEEEKSLFRFGEEQGLGWEKMTSLVEAELKKRGAQRAPQVVAATPVRRSVRSTRRPRSLDPREDFMRMLRLSGLDGYSMTDDQRDAFINMAENLGLEPGHAEDLVDSYLEEADQRSDLENASLPTPPPVKVIEVPPKEEASVAPIAQPIVVEGERSRFSNFESSIGGQMIFISSSEFVMGSEEAEAAPNERPLTPVTLSRFYMARHLITNAQYEEFDSSHARKRAAGTGDRHPVVYVSSLDAIKFCQWLTARERKKYRLPTEAEWEYTARGTDRRKYPWGNHSGSGNLANYADRNTVFAWSDRDIDDGYPESSPVGAFPHGVSPFGIDDMAGNVWEWCLDYFEAYRGAPKVNPRGAPSGMKRVYRGGSWKSRFNSLRTTARSSNAPNYSCNDLGFRVVCECDKEV
ncbi:MAG: SUMF1/EgtB/PvdO family nonheme iron enzyme [Verrucomicrobiota bacterium]